MYKMILSENELKQIINGEVLEKFKSIREASRVTGIDSSCIVKVCKGNRKSAGGFLWRYK